MGKYHIFSAYEEFRTLWTTISSKSLKDQIRAYEDHFQTTWPELWQMQTENYEEEGESWEKVAAEYVFPKFPQQIPLMPEIHQKLQNNIPWVFIKAVEEMHFTFDINFVLYVGLGVGAGWATKYHSKRAVLQGLENIVDCGWFSDEALAALTAHEIGHLVHQEWRDQAHLPNLPDPTTNNPALWDLYEEGFAMRAEHKIMGKESFHESEGQDNWVEWCHANKQWLAQQYLAHLNDKEELKRFFGSWFEIEGKKQTGYFLGHEMLKEWEITIPFKEIALLTMDEIDERVLTTLKRWV